ncbi:MAG: hypothetical protein WAT09_10075, partial [Paracoccaceae bacterium]
PGPAGLAGLAAESRAEIARAVPGLALALRLPGLLATIYGPRVLDGLSTRTLHGFDQIQPPGEPLSSQHRCAAD